MIQNTFQQPLQQAITGFEPTRWDVHLAFLGLGLVFSILLQWHFQTFGSSLSNRREFSRTFPMIILTTILVIGIVKHSWQLGLGLVGALSIVRFRTPIKEPEELAYLFLAIGLGIGFGAQLWEVTITAGLAILFALSVLHWTRRDKQSKGLFLSVEWSHGEDILRPLEKMTDVIGAHATSNDLRRVDRHGHSLDATFFVDFPNMGELSDLLAALDELCPGATVTVIDQNRLPTV